MAAGDDKTSERRDEPRAEVAIWVEERTNDALYFQRATNLSASGIWLDGTLPHPPGTRVALDFDLGDGPVKVVGEVVARKPDDRGMAVRFIEMKTAIRERIEAFLAASLTVAELKPVA
jgi:hypothetical protein